MYDELEKSYNNNLFDLIPLVVKYNIDNIDWKKYVKFNKSYYNRIKLEEYSNNMFEFVLICWLPKQKSLIHNHPTNGCIMKILEGNIEETLYDNNMNITSINMYVTNDTTYIDNNKGIHKINPLDKSVTLHIYSPPNYIFKKYNE